MTKCLKCGAEATAQFSPDLDIEGVGACEDHKTEIRNDLLFAGVTDKWNWFNKKYNNKKKKK